MKLTIITINFNGSASTVRLLGSLASQTDKDFEICVVDNSSAEEDLRSLENGLSEITRSGFANISLIRSGDNMGFSGGNNLGISRALKNGSDWMLLLNNDTWVDTSFMASLKPVLSEKRGIVGLPLVENGKTAFCGTVRWLKPTLKHVHEESRIIISEFYAIGGAMAVHKDVFREVGMLDEKYFLYFEDADFSIRAERGHFTPEFTSEVRVYHQVSESAKKLGSPLLLRYHYRNALYFNLKLGPERIKFMVAPWSAWIFLKQVFKIFLLYKQKESIAIMLGIIDFYTGRMGKIKN